MYEQAKSAGLGNRLTEPPLVETRGYGLDTPAPSVNGGVQTELEAMSQALAQHENALSELVARVEPVTRIEPTNGGKEGQVSPSRPICAVGDVIREQRRRLELMTYALKDVARRIDL